jgi:hypothetical protein
VNNPYHFCLIAGVCAAIVCAEADGKTKKETAGNPLCIHVYNLAAMSPQTAEHTTRWVSRVFARSDITISWQHPPTDSEEAHVTDLNDSAGSFASAERPCLVVKIVPDVPPGAYHTALGFSLPQSRAGIHVELIYRRMELQAESAAIATYVVLAYAMAHEIGHVLLSSSCHSPAGIMRARADGETWRLASFGLMEFLPDQSKQMRKRLSGPKQPPFPNRCDE